MMARASTLACLAATVATITATLQQQAGASSATLYVCQNGQCVPNARGLPLSECEQVCAPLPNATYICQANNGTAGSQCVISSSGLPKAECTQVCGGPGPAPPPSPPSPCLGPKLCGTCPGLPDMNIDGSIVQMNTSEFCNICHHQYFGDEDDNQPVRALCSRRRMLEVGRRCAGTGLTVSSAVVTLTKDGALFRRRCVLDRVREPVFTHHKVKRKPHHPLTSTRHVCHLAA